MAYQTESTSVRQIFLQPFKSSRNETPLRERVSPKLRIQSELRGSTKMPPILSPITNTSVQSNKTLVFPVNKTPLRRVASKAESSLQRLEENLSEDFPLKTSKLLSVDTSGDAKSFFPFMLKDHITPTSTVASEMSLYTPNPMTNKSLDSPPTKLASIKGKSSSTRRPVNSKDPAAKIDRRLYESNIAGSQLDRREFSSSHENISPHPIGNPYNFLPLLGPTRCSTKHSGVIKAYAANTNQGLVRDYNEDRVAIILNIMKPHNTVYEGEWPMCSFFGIYDGHGGAECADFLRDNLHQFVLRDRNFPSNPVEALKNGFEEAEKKFTEIAQKYQPDINRSGSCAIVVLIVDDTCYVANVGDSRAVMSCEQGKKAVALSRDHKPNEDYERERIQSNGGKVYQTQISQPVKQGNNGTVINKTIFGPHRVFPGRLSVSRTFGDIEAKIVQYGGTPGVVVATPEIVSYKLTKENDFILLGCDGIFDVMDDESVVKCVWDSAKAKCNDVHQQTSVAVEDVLNESMIQRSMDNITVILISLEGFHEKLFSNENSEVSDKGNIVPTKLLANIFQKRVSSGVNKLRAINHNPFKKSLISDPGNESNGKSEEPFQANVQQMIGSTSIPLSATWRHETQKGDFNPNYDNYGKADIIAKKLNVKLRKLK